MQFDLSLLIILNTQYLMQTLKPKMFVKANEKSEKYECAICNYITQKPYLCKGKCQKYFCFQCINCIKRNTNQCPFKCSKPFDLIECKELQLQFSCPFAKNECQNQIGSLSQFYQHAYVCKHTPQNWKFKESNYKQYRCDKGHDLFFLDEQDLRKIHGWDFYQSPTNSICSSCSTKGLSRSICPKCSQKDKHVLYCTNCRKPPCTKKTCLYQHNLIKQMNSSEGLICDFCGTAAYLLGPYAFRDLICNFDICQVCYINLPQTHELVPFKMPKSAISHLFNNHQENQYQNQGNFGSTLARILGMRRNLISHNLVQAQHRIEQVQQAVSSDSQSDEQEQINQIAVEGLFMPQDNFQEQEQIIPQQHLQPQDYFQEQEQIIPQQHLQPPHQQQIASDQENLPDEFYD